MVIRRMISLDARFDSSTARKERNVNYPPTYFDDRNHIGRRHLEFAIIDVKVVQLILFRFLEHELRALADGMDAFEIRCRIECGVRRL